MSLRAAFDSDLTLHTLAIALLIGVWWLSASLFFSPLFFPTPDRVVVKAWYLLQDGSLLENTWASVQRILLGFLIGSAIGAPIGLTMGAFRRVHAIIDVYVEIFRFIPSIAWLTPAIIWFGIGETSKVFIIVYTTVFVVILNTAVGVKNISPDKINAARSLGANRWQLFMLVIVPATVPFILTGMRLAMANSFTTVVSAEMVAASHGLGYLIWSSRVYFETDAIFVSMAMLGLLGFLADRVFRIMTTRFARRFHTHSD